MTSIFALTLLAVVATMLVAINKRRSIASKVRQRNRISDEEIWNHFSSAGGLDREKVIEVWYELSKCLEIDPALLRPDDEFGKTVGRGAFFLTPELDRMSDWAEHRAKTLGAKVDLSEIRTVDQLVFALAK